MVCNCGTITTKLTYFWECKSCGRIDWHTKPKKKQVRKPEMSKRVKIHRLLRSCTSLSIKETEFLMQIYGMMNTGKEKMVSGKQKRWAEALLNKHGEKHGAKKLSRTSNN